MDRNSIIGFVLIFLIFVGFSYWNTPSKEELAAQQAKRDSIAQVQKEQRRLDSLRIANAAQEEAEAAPLAPFANADDSVNQQQSLLKEKYGSFSLSAASAEQHISVESKMVKWDLQNLGGKLSSVELKTYKAYDSSQLILFKGNENKFGLNFFAANRLIDTENHYFKIFVNGHEHTAAQNIQLSESETVIIAMRLYADAAYVSQAQQYIEYLYTFKGDSYMFDFDINIVGLDGLIDTRNGYLDFNWITDLRLQERTVDRYNGSCIYYRYDDDDVDYLADNSDEEEKLKSRVSWVSFKQRFFNMTLIADDAFDNGNIKQFHKAQSADSQYQLTTSALMAIPIRSADKGHFGARMYMGPNEFKRLENFEIDLERIIPIGWSFFLMAWINKYIVLNVFSWLGGWGWNYGIVILVLTILLKIVLLPIAYRTYKSSAKMRVLKPEVDAINEKYKDNKDPMKKQQAVMNLYKRAGANPMSGCVPMLLQMPILLAFFRFFPSSIELRQKSFLWAHDLSSYDSIWDFPNGFSIPFYGDHVSLFTLLMTVSTIIYTKVNSQSMGSGNNQMPGMKTMMYLMPIMFLGLFNSYASSLSYYYFLANMITFLQMWLIRRTINDDKLRAQMQANKQKPVKKSRFQQRLEEMAKQQQTQQKRRK